MKLLEIDQIIAAWDAANAWNIASAERSLDIPIDIPKDMDNILDRYNYDHKKLSMQAHGWMKKLSYVYDLYVETGGEAFE